MGRELLTSRLGDLVGRPLTLLQDPGTTPEDPPGTSPDESGLPPEIAGEAIRSYLDARYRLVLDDPLPVLDGNTPRQAAAKRGRRQVIDWLKHIENAEHHRATQHGGRPYSTAWIWRELGIEAPR